jgi:hypothetical protein
VLHFPDPETGGAIWTTNSSFVGSTVRPDGNILGLRSHNEDAGFSVAMFNGVTGQLTEIPIQEWGVHTTTQPGPCYNPGNYSFFLPANAGPATTDADGKTYLEYEITNVKEAHSCPDGFVTTVSDFALKLMTIAPDGSTSTQTLATSQMISATPNSYSGSFLGRGSTTPDGQGGALVTWSETAAGGSASYMVGHVTPTGNTTFHLTPLDNSFAFPVIALGENGTAFATNGSDIEAFDMNSGQALWTDHRPFVTSMFAKADGGLTITGDDSYQREILTSVGPQSDGTTMYMRSASPRSLSFWVGGVNGNLSAVSGPNTILVASAYPVAPHGGRAATYASPLPIIKNFEPVDPDPATRPALKLQDRYLSTTPLDTKTHGSSFVLDRATFDNFEKEIAKPLEAAAFIGHSLTVQDIAVALGFRGQFILPDYLSVQYFSLIGQHFQDNQNNDYVVSIGASPIKTDANIVFIAACDLSADNLQQFLGGTLGAGRALVVPDGVQDIGLAMGEFAWLQIAKHLAEGGNNLQQAVDRANSDLDGKTWKDGNGNVVPAVHWKVIGDGWIKFH